ncbi:MAG: hypothetical protein ACFFHV_00390 [Promethearchaeota archaeon]
MKCPHCGNDCSPRADICPKCGKSVREVRKKIEAEKRQRNIIFNVVVFLILLVCAVFIPFPLKWIFIVLLIIYIIFLLWYLQYMYGIFY